MDTFSSPHLDVANLSPSIKVDCIWEGIHYLDHGDVTFALLTISVYEGAFHSALPVVSLSWIIIRLLIQGFTEPSRSGQIESAGGSHRS